MYFLERQLQYTLIDALTKLAYVDECIGCKLIACFDDVLASYDSAYTDPSWSLGHSLITQPHSHHRALKSTANGEQNEHQLIRPSNKALGETSPNFEKPPPPVS